MSSVNVLHILRTIKERTSVSRTDLQQLTGLSWGTITNTTRELLNRNLIREEDALSTKAGRRPVKLAINPASHCMIGIDIAPQRIQCLAMNLAGEALSFVETAGPADGRPPVEVLQETAAMLRETLAGPDIVRRICLGVGVSVPGAVDVERGVLRFAPRLPGWEDVPLREILQEGCAVTVRIEHDPNCLVLAERWFGDAAHAHDVLCVHLGEGVGLGMLLGGDIFRGSQQMAGEFGHMTLDPNGPPCACGDRGCVEAYCSTSALLAHAQASGATEIRTFEELLARAARRDSAALAAFEHFGTYLGIGLANLIDLLNPDLIVLAGPVIPASAAFMPALDRAIAQHAWRHSGRQFLISRLGERAKVMGACGMVLQAALSENPVAAESASE